jgi:regulator of nucleoside diphosphate kinase
MATRKKTCYLTELDIARLEKHAAQASPQSGYLAMLDELMERASVVDSRQIAANVVTMNSKVTLIDSDTGEPMTWTVVYPPQADFSRGQLNVFSPVGLALLGAECGDTIRFTPPSGQEKTLQVEKIVFQPEAADDFTL